MARYAASTSLALFAALLSLWSATFLSALASPLSPAPTALGGLSQASPQPLVLARGVSAERRQDDGSEPVFPAQPPSCPICQQNFGSIDSCAQAAPVLQNFSMIIFNPGAFIDVIKCACADTFQSAYPQCVDCFIKTNQTSFLDSDSANLPGIVDGMRKICALESTLLGNVSNSDGETTPTSSAAAATATTTANGASSLSSSWSWSAVAVAVLSSFVAALL
ncbi:hypothetical protein BD309DRAFT_923096 [Dichomitus squalens]|uniref:Uncharacterized protein n=1 Tax=Dichomitus squalens TaxID=114155 RepID=A0A4Q9PZE9_9APHY|nr:hypothetical protein BD309DRAFT_923096 [Dichomitus squalens]TBU59956.1 hypothetical protein BD310DRAFT_876368 [Dichomitus squalens]